MRPTLALLLLFAVLVHPVIHVDDPVVCACAHGALLEVEPPEVARVSTCSAAHHVELDCYAPIAPSAEIPARAPPAA